MSGVSSVILSAISSSVIVMPTMSVISPEPYTVISGSEAMLPGLVIKVPEVVSVIGSTSDKYQKGLHRKLMANERCSPQDLLKGNLVDHAGMIKATLPVGEGDCAAAAEPCSNSVHSWRHSRQNAQRSALRRSHRTARQGYQPAGQPWH